MERSSRIAGLENGRQPVVRDLTMNHEVHEDHEGNGFFGRSRTYGLPDPGCPGGHAQAGSVARRYNRRPTSSLLRRAETDGPRLPEVRLVCSVNSVSSVVIEWQ